MQQASESRLYLVVVQLYVAVALKLWDSLRKANCSSANAKTSAPLLMMA